MIYQWTLRNREHIGKHAVRDVEAQYVVEYARAPFPRGSGDGKQLVWGQTESGRYLQVIFVYLRDDEVDLEWLSPLDRIRFQEGEEVAMVIHARDLKNNEKHQLRRIMRHRT
jgi:hypothetical protein